MWTIEFPAYHRMVPSFTCYFIGRSMKLDQVPKDYVSPPMAKILLPLDTKWSTTSGVRSISKHTSGIWATCYWCDGYWHGSLVNCSSLYLQTLLLTYVPCSSASISSHRHVSIYNFIIFFFIVSPVDDLSLFLTPYFLLDPTIAIQHSLPQTCRCTLLTIYNHRHFIDAPMLFLPLYPAFSTMLRSMSRTFCI